jgi:hypothetical protein
MRFRYVYIRSIPVKRENVTMTTMTKTVFGLALVLATASGALAATHGHKNTQPTASVERQAYPVVDDAVHVPFPQQGGN